MSRQAYVDLLDKLKKRAEELEVQAAKLDPFLKSSNSGPRANEHGQPALQADRRELVDELTTVRAAISRYLSEVSSAYRHCFADNECKQKIGAKIGLIGLEKAGKSTFLSGWATNGATSELLPSATVACTGTTVQMYSNTRSDKFSASVEYFTQQDFAIRLLGVCSVVDQIVPHLGLAGANCPTVRDGVAGLRHTPPVESETDLNTLAAELRTLLYTQAGQDEKEWTRAKDELLQTKSDDANRKLDYMKTLDKLLAGFRSFGSKLDEPPELIPEKADAGDLGKLLWPFISQAKLGGNKKALDFKENLQPLVVKLVSLLGPLPGLPDEIEINDLPGLDSSHQELNQRTTDAYKEMDIIVFVKSSMTNHPQLWPSERRLLQQVQSSVDPTLSRVLALVNCINADLSLAKGLPENSLVTGQDIAAQFLPDKDRILFGFADVIPNRKPFDEDRVKEVVADAKNNGFTIDSKDLNGYKRFTQQLQEMVAAMPQRDIAQGKKLKAGFEALQKEIARVAKQLGNRGVQSSKDTSVEKTLRSLYDEELLPAIQSNVNALKHNTADNAQESLLPNCGTLFYFQPSLFEREAQFGFQLAPRAAIKPKSELHCSFDDKETFPTYHELFIAAGFDAARATQEEVNGRLIDAIGLDGGAVSETKQKDEDDKYLDKIRTQLASDLTTRSVGSVIPWLAAVRQKFTVWLGKVKEREPITFSAMEGHYRRLVREEFNKIIQWIQRIDHANKLSTLDHLIDVTLLTQTYSHKGCLLNLFVARAASDLPEAGLGAAELEDYLKQVKIDIYDGVSARLQEVASDTLKLLLGVQRERELDNPGVRISAFDKVNDESLRNAKNKLQRVSYVKLIQAPCGHTIVREHDVCQHAGWAPFDWSNYLNQLNGKRIQLVENRRQLASELPDAIRDLHDSIDTLETALAQQAPGIFKHAGADSTTQLMNLAPGYSKDYRPADTSALRRIQSLDTASLARPASMSVEELQSELLTYQTCCPPLVNTWETAKTQWVDSSKRYSAVVTWLTGEISGAMFSKRYVSEQQALLKEQAEVNKAKANIAACNVWLGKLDGSRKQLQDQIATDMHHPSLTRKAFLESLFCVPLEFTKQDVEGSKKAQATTLGATNGVTATVTQLLMFKQKRAFIESEDFVVYGKDTDDAQHLMENFPPVGGPEWDVLMDVIHTRTMKALEHVTELICHAIKEESSLAKSRERIVDEFWNELHTPKGGDHGLWSIVTVYRDKIWPQLFAGTSNQIDHVAICLRTLNTAAAKSL